MSLNLLVETTLLNSMVGQDSWVYVKIGPEYVRKKGRDLNVGDVVVVRNEGISKTLEEIEPVLEQSMRYKLARDGIHRQGADGRYVPLLRTLLLEGLAVHDLSLEEKLRAGNDLSDEEYTQLAQHIAPEVTVTKSAVRDWLTGETLAPADWENFQRLTPINPLFDGIYQSKDQATGFHADYHLYTGARRTIMSHLAKRRGEKEGSPQRPQKDPRNKFTAEIELVVSYFMEEIDDTHDAARVTKITHLSAHKGSSDKEAPDPHLSKGIATDFAVDLVDMNEVIDARYLLFNTFAQGMEKYFQRKFQSQDVNIVTDHLNSGWGNPSFSRVLPDHLQEAAVMLGLGVFCLAESVLEDRIVIDTTLRPNVEVVQKATNLSYLEMTRLLQREYTSFQQALQKGEVDQALLTDPHATIKLIDLLRRYQHAVPRTYEEMQEDIANINLFAATTRGKILPKDERENLERQKKQVAGLLKVKKEYLNRTYGVEFNDKRKQLYYPFITHTAIHYTPPEIDISELLTPEWKRIFEQGSEKWRFYTRGEVKAVFTQLGIPSATRMVKPENFL